ncbi:CAP domain-containing protein [Ferruginibacter paludis]|uniref:CAP domain-containing protein n=1 Tax=Ferruginibacter paludis TaxID=1310417 RepID=UPI0025B34324|nr:CAP domain-containing protein [Ferruginibacter paludis]MDN3654932.1 CAP domain-containing protein [Ferruginibacter paludis]
MKPTFLIISLTCLISVVSLSSFVGWGETGIVEDVFSLTNQFRKSKGLNGLIMQQQLNAIAQQHSQAMASGKVAFGHGGFAKRNAMASRQIPQLHSFAENVAYGATSGSQVVSLWKNSAGHRRNMLGHFKYIGIGIARDKQGRIFYTEVFGG